MWLTTSIVMISDNDNDGKLFRDSQLCANVVIFLKIVEEAFGAILVYFSN